MPIPEVKFVSKAGEIIAARAETIGSQYARQSMQDRSEIQAIKTNGGLELLVGLVADGMGGGEDGEIAAEMTKNDILTAISSSTGKDVAQILNDAIQTAQSNVLADTNLHNAGSTAVVVAVHGDRLYVANVGDSRAYLVRGGKLYQLTEDQTWGNEMLKSGMATMEELKRLSKRVELAQYVGYQKPIKVDTKAHFPEKQESSYVTLEPGDGILVCSDGLIKERPNSEAPFVYDHEITNTFTSEPPLATANMLVAFAKGRKVDDNVSAIVIQLSGKSVSKMLISKVSQKGGKMVMPVVVGIAALILVALVVFALLNLAPGRPSAQPTLPVGMITATSKVTVAAGTGQVLEASLAQYSMPGKNAEYLKAGQEITAGQGVRLWTPTKGRVVIQLSGGQKIYIDQNTQIYLVELADAGQGIQATTIRMERGNVYVSGENAEFKVNAANKEGWFAQVKGSKMGISFDGQGSFKVECFAGACQVGSPAKVVDLNAGQGGGFEESALGEARNGVYEQWLTLAAGDVPEPTATATPTPTLTPTITLTPTPTATRYVKPPTPAPPQKDDDHKDNPGSGGGSGSG